MTILPPADDPTQKCADVQATCTGVAQGLPRGVDCLPSLRPHISLGAQLRGWRVPTEQELEEVSK